MGILEIIAEQRLGLKTMKAHPKLRHAFERVEKATQRPKISSEEKERIATIVELCFEYERESDSEEKSNILRTLDEISANEPLEMPGETVESWEDRLKETDSAYAKVDREASRAKEVFLKKYFSLRAKAGLQTQAAVAKASGLTRSYIAVIETGDHFPQQKTLQKLAKALGVDVTGLLP